MFALLSFSEFLPALLAGCIAALCGIGLMGTAAWLITKAALQPPLYALTLGITGVRACGIGRAVFRYLDRFLSHRMAFHFYAKLQAKLYRQTEAVLPMKEGPAKQGAFLELLTKGCATLRDFWLRAFLPPVITLLLTLLAVYALHAYVGTAAYLLLCLWLLHLCLPYLLLSDNKKEAAANYRSLLLDTQAGVDELICAQTQAKAQARLQSSAKILQHTDAKIELRQDICTAVLDILSACTLLFFFARLYQAPCSIIELGVWLLVLMALLNEFRPLVAAARHYREAQPVKRALLQPQLKTPKQQNKQQTNVASAPYLLSVQNLSFSYHPHQPVFAPLSFQIKPGQHTAIIGESGAGKTTLGYLLTGLWAPDAGTIVKGGAIATALQGSFLFSASMRENFLRLHPGITEAAIQHSLMLAQLSDFVEQLPQGIDTPIGTDGAFLSGGQRTRLLTALTIASSAPLLLLDEPTAGLDQQTAKALIASLLTHVQKTKQTLLIITHDQSLQAKMQQQIFLT